MEVTRRCLACPAGDLSVEFGNKRLDQWPVACPGRKFPPRIMEQIVPMLQSVGVNGVLAQSASTPDGRHQVLLYAAIQLHLDTGCLLFTASKPMPPIPAIPAAKIGSDARRNKGCK